MLDDSDEREVLKHLAEKIVHFDEQDKALWNYFIASAKPE